MGHKPFLHLSYVMHALQGRAISGSPSGVQVGPQMESCISFLLGVGFELGTLFCESFQTQGLPTPLTSGDLAV